MSRKDRKFNRFFHQKLGDLQKKKKKKVFGKIQSDFSAEIQNSNVFSAQNHGISKKKKKRSSAKFRVIFRPKSKIQTFFPPKIMGSPKKKKKKGLRQISRRFFFQNFASSNVSGGALFAWGGAIFNFSQKIGLKSTKNMRFCILNKPMGGARAPPAPPLATLLQTNHYCS